VTETIHIEVAEPVRGYGLPVKPRSMQDVELPGASPGYPGWVCKNNIEHKYPPDYGHDRCPECLAPLVRWLGYEVKR
jgi:hypothetical protein